MVTKRDRRLRSDKMKYQRRLHVERAEIFAAVKLVNDNPTEIRWINLGHRRLEIAAWNLDMAKPGQEILCYEHGRFFVTEFMDKDGRYVYDSKAKGNTALDQIIALIRSCHER